MAHVKGNSYAYINSSAYGDINMKPISLQALSPTVQPRDLEIVSTGTVLVTRTAAVSDCRRDAEEHLHTASRFSRCIACAAHAGVVDDSVRGPFRYS